MRGRKEGRKEGKKEEHGIDKRKGDRERGGCEGVRV